MNTLFLITLGIFMGLVFADCASRRFRTLMRRDLTDAQRLLVANRITIKMQKAQLERLSRLLGECRAAIEAESKLGTRVQWIERGDGAVDIKERP